MFSIHGGGCNQSAIMRSFEEILQDRAFLEGMEGKTKEEILAMFAAEGYKMTEAELQEVFNILAEESTASEDELSEENLEAVAGGMLLIRTPFGPVNPYKPVSRAIVKWLRDHGFIK